MNIKFGFTFVAVLSLLLLNACKDPGPRSSGSGGGILLPNVAGAAGEVLVVMDNFNWKNNAGNILRNTLEQEYPGLPQAEPIFDVVHITRGAFDNLFEMHRTIMLVAVDSEIPEASIRYSENVWARPQLVIRIDAPDSYALESLVEKEKSNILQNILAYDRKRLQDVYNDSKDTEIRDIVSQYNINLSIPRGYNVDFSTEDFASISIETPRSSQVLFVYQYPYQGDFSLNTEYIIEKRNEFLQKYTEGTRTGSYLTTATLYPPLAYDVKKNGMDIVEVRGLWELKNGYMGGPFISHSVYDKSRNMVVVTEGYVYNPSGKKRNMMRQLEAIVYSMNLLNK